MPAGLHLLNYFKRLSGLLLLQVGQTRGADETGGDGGLMAGNIKKGRSLGIFIWGLDIPMRPSI